MAERRSEVWLTSLRNTSKTHTFPRNAGIRDTRSQLPLDRKMNSNFKSSYRNGADFGRLESYWKHICEQENNSKKRNKSLMEDFERIEQQVSSLDAKTQKLKNLRDQYNSYINKMYPRWLEELKYHRHMIQQERNGFQQQVSRAQVKRPEGIALPQDHVQPRDFSREMGPGLRGSNHVRFISPEQSSLYQQDSSLYDSQQTRPQDQTSYCDQSSTQGYIDPTRYKTMEWDPYQRDPSFDYYHFGQVSSLRTPNGHMSQQPANLLRFSTPYNPGHSGPLDPRNGFNQSFDMSYLSHGYERGPHPRHPYVGSPMMHQSPDGRLVYNENMRPAMPGQGGPLNPEAGMSYSTSYDERDGPVRQPTQQQRSPVDREQSMSLAQSECNGSLNSTSTSPYARDPPEKPLELTADKKPVKPVPSEKKRLPQDPQLASSDEFTTPSPLVLTDLGPVSSDAGQGKGQTDKGLLDASENEEDDQSDLSEGSLSLSLGDMSSSDISLPDEGEAKKLSKTQEAHSENMTRKPSLTDKPGNSLQKAGDKEEMERPSHNDKLQKSVPQESHEEETKTQEAHDGVTRKPSLEQSGSPKGAHGGVTRKPSLTDDLEQSSSPQGAHDARYEKDSHEKISDKDEDDTSDIDTDQKAKVQERKTSEVKQMTKHQEDQPKADTESILKYSKDTENKQPSVTIQVLLTLLQVVDADIEVSFSPETIYRAPPCSQAMKEDIIRSAESDGHTLDAYDPSSISMIILEEIPLLVRASPSGCLIQDQILLSGETYSTLKQLRSIVESTLVPLWDSLLPHMTKLVEHNVLAVDEAAKMFGSLLLKQDSKCCQQFQTVLIDLIKGIISGEHDITSITSINDPAEQHVDNSLKTPQKDDSHSLASDESSTLGSTPPIYDKEPQSKGQTSDDPPRSLERTLSYEDDFEEDDVPLNETAAYRKMMSSAQSTVDDLSDSQGKTDPKEDEESEGDDDLERTLARSISPPPMSPRQQSTSNNKTPEEKKPGRQKPKLSLFGGGAGSLGLSYGSEDLGDSWGGNESGKLTSSLKSNATDKSVSVVSDEDISPPSSLDLDLEPAYIPSAMDSGNKKDEPGETARKPATKITRKPEFWNHSDTESEVDLQLSTGAADAEDDDFDFYG